MIVKVYILDNLNVNIYLKGNLNFFFLVYVNGNILFCENMFVIINYIIECMFLLESLEDLF